MALPCCPGPPHRGRQVAASPSILRSDVTAAPPSVPRAAPFPSPLPAPRPQPTPACPGRAAWPGVAMVAQALSPSGPSHAPGGPCGCSAVALCPPPPANPAPPRPTLPLAGTCHGVGSVQALSPGHGRGWNGPRALAVHPGSTVCPVRADSHGPAWLQPPCS